MEITTGLLTFFLILATSAVIAWLVISQRKGIREKQPPEADEAQQEVDEMRPPTPAAEDQLTAGQDGAPIAQETQSTGEKAQPTAAQEVERIVPKETQPTAIPETKVATPEKAESPAVQGAEQIEGEETQPQAVPEELRPIAPDTKQAAPKEAPTTTPEDPQTTLVEKVQPQVVEKPQPREPIQGTPGAKQGRRKPIHRGGRPRGPTRPQERRATRETASRRPKPEIVCWKRARQWFIGVEVPEDLFREGDDLEVYQDGSPLSRDDSREGCWLLHSISGQVTVQWNEGDAIEEVNLTLGQDGYLLFKLSGEGLSQGRRVKSASSGSYLVAAPDSWERDEMVAGAPPVMPESVALDGYSAHFFDLEKGGETRIAFRTPGGDPIAVPSSSARFELVGVQLEDRSEGLGPLFSDPPKIRALDPQTWKGVKTIVIGEEGPGKGKWRTAFNPDTDGQEQEVPSELRDRRGGWYFLRFYDGNDELIESMDFRFLSGLKEIRVPELSPLPSGDGHKAVCMQLFHEPGITIQAVEDVPNIRVERGDSQTTITVPPDPKFDVTRWLIGYERGPQVEVTILVERLWWNLGEETAEPSQWEDKPLALSPNDLIATSKKTLWLRFPKCRWVDNILVGFERAKARPYPIKVAEKTLAIPLREFADAKEAMDQTQDQRLKVWVERDNVEMEGVVAVIPAVPPRPRWVGIGRYKTALATAVLQHGSGNITVNDFSINQYFRKAPTKARRFLGRLRGLPTISDVLSRLDAYVEVEGSSPDTMRQAKAVAHALARALMAYDPELKPLLKRQGFGGVKVRTMSKSRRDKQ